MAGEIKEGSDRLAEVGTVSLRRQRQIWPYRYLNQLLGHYRRNDLLAGYQALRTSCPGPSLDQEVEALACRREKLFTLDHEFGRH